jgi:gamma-glutamylputrescine oxidase
MEDEEDYINFVSTHCNHKMWLADKPETQRRLGTDVYAGSMVDDDAGSMNPLAYLNHMASEIVKEGVTIYEETPAIEIRRESDGNCVIVTPNANIRAEQIVSAGDAYQGWLMPKLRSKYVLLRTSMLATAVLPDDIYAEIIPSNTAAYEWCGIFNYFNKSSDGRLIFGGGDSPLTGTPKEKRKAFNKIYDNMCDIFPKLQNVHVTHWWSGYFSVTQKLAPEIGRLNGFIYYAIGYSGHGIVPSHMAAHTIAEAIVADRKSGKHTMPPVAETSVLTILEANNIPGAGHYDQLLGRMGLFWEQIKDRFTG